MGWKGIFLRASLGVLALSAALVVFAGYEYHEVFGGGKEVYETIPPDLPAMKPTAILIFTKTNGFRHGDSIAAGTKALVDLISNRGWSSFVTDNSAVFNQAQLAKFKAVICNNTSGNNLLPAQQAAFTQYMTDGGGFVGIHASGGDPSYKWRWYVDTL